VGDARESSRETWHWQRLTQIVAFEGQQLGGYGKVTFEVTYSDGVPQRVEVMDRKPSYRLDRDAPPLPRDEGSSTSSGRGGR
jgi:hypothetical protein